MAVKKFKPFPILKQPKFPVYDCLYKINLAFQSIAFEIERLDDYEAIPLGTLRLYRATAEELRAGMNNKIVSVLLYREDRDWGHYGKARLAILEKLKKRKTGLK